MASFSETEADGWVDERGIRMDLVALVRAQPACAVGRAQSAHGQAIAPACRSQADFAFVADCGADEGGNARRRGALGP